MTLSIDENTKRRDKLSIIADILEISRAGALKTQIMYRANLSFTQLNDYLEFMLTANLLADYNTNGKDVYSATTKGTNFVQRYYELTDLVRLENRKNGAKIPPRKY